MPAIFQFEYDFKWQSSVFNTISIDSICLLKKDFKIEKVWLVWSGCGGDELSTDANGLCWVAFWDKSWSKFVYMECEIDFYSRQSEEWRDVMRKNNKNNRRSIWLLVKRPLFAWASKKNYQIFMHIWHSVCCVRFDIRVIWQWRIEDFGFLNLGAIEKRGHIFFSSTKFWEAKKINSDCFKRMTHIKRDDISSKMRTFYI